MLLQYEKKGDLWTPISSEDGKLIWSSYIWCDTWSFLIFVLSISHQGCFKDTYTIPFSECIHRDLSICTKIIMLWSHSKIDAVIDALWPICPKIQKSKLSDKKTCSLDCLCVRISWSLQFKAWQTQIRCLVVEHPEFLHF